MGQSDDTPQIVEGKYLSEASAGKKMTKLTPLRPSQSFAEASVPIALLPSFFRFDRARPARLRPFRGRVWQDGWSFWGVTLSKAARAV